MIIRGSVWGLGHTITLLTICGALLLLGESIPTRAEAFLELAVGIMIVLLGVNLLHKLRRKRPHFHVHDHSDGASHIHLHTHAGGNGAHKESSHEHAHENLGLARALLVGMMHGAAGSAGLLIVAAATDSIMQAITYVLAFGTGSIVGMAILSFVISYPLRWAERCADWVNTAAFVSIGCIAIFIGGNLIVHSWGVW